MRRAAIIAGWLLLGAVPLLAQAAPSASPAAAKPAATTPAVATPAAAKTAAAKTAAKGASAKRTKAVRRRSAKPTAVVEIPPPPPRKIPVYTPEQMPAQPPQVLYANGVLTVDSQNSSLGDILALVRRYTGMHMELISGAPVDRPPNANDRVAAHFSGTPRDVVSALLDGSHLGYILVAPPDNPNSVRTVILTVAPQTQVAQRGAPNAGQPPVPPPVADTAPDEEELAPAAIGLEAQPQVGQPQPGAPGLNNNTLTDQQQQAPGGPPAQLPPPPGVPQPSGDGSQPNPNQPQYKTPAELLQELQRMRNQNNNGNPAPPTNNQAQP